MHNQSTLNVSRAARLRPVVLLLFCGLFLLLPPAVRALTWGYGPVDSTDEVGMFTSLALDSAGNPHISYYDVTNSALKYATWNGTMWDIVTVDNDNFVGLYSSLALDSNGYPHISYFDGTRSALRYAAWNGTMWVIEIVDDDLDRRVGQHTSLALDSNDRPRISYYDQGVDDLKYASWNGSTWDIAPVDSDGDVGQYTSLALDSNDHPRISYHDATNGDLKYAAWNPAGWVSVKVDGGDGDFVGEYTSLALDSNDRPRISYSRFSYAEPLNRDLKYAAWNGSTWVIDTVANISSEGTHNSLELDSHDDPHISYYDINAGSLGYATWNGSEWVSELVDTNHAGEFTSLALDACDNPRISYFDLFHESLKYAAAEGECAQMTVNKVVNGGPATWSFDFSGDLGDFTLSDGDPSQSFTGLSLDDYLISETADPNYSTTIECDNGDSSPTNDITVSLEPGDNDVTCTVTNTRNTGTIVIIKNASPADNTLFSFTENITSGGSGFTLNDPDAKTETFSNVPTGSYTVAETVPAPWLLVDIDCNDVNSVENEAAATATINLEKDEMVICTFSNSNTTPPAAPSVFMSAKTAGKTSDNVAFGSEDILMYDGSAWSVWFDGSLDAGLNPAKTYHNIDAFWIPDPAGNEVFLSFTRNQRPVEGINGMVDGMDIVRWDGTAFSLLFDGQDVGLQSLTTENIDALHILPGSEWTATGDTCLHYLLISTKGVGTVPTYYNASTLKFSGEDVLGFCLTQAGATTTGQWAMVLDGSAVGMNKGSTDSISFNADGQTMYLTTTSKFIANGVLLGTDSRVYAYHLSMQTFNGPIFVAPAEGLPKVVDGLQVN